VEPDNLSYWDFCCFASEVVVHVVQYFAAVFETFFNGLKMDWNSNDLKMGISCVFTDREEDCGVYISVGNDELVFVNDYRR